MEKLTSSRTVRPSNEIETLRKSITGSGGRRTIRQTGSPSSVCSGASGSGLKVPDLDWMEIEHACDQITLPEKRRGFPAYVRRRVDIQEPA